MGVCLSVCLSVCCPCLCLSLPLSLFVSALVSLSLHLCRCLYTCTSLLSVCLYLSAFVPLPLPPPPSPPCSNTYTFPSSITSHNFISCNNISNILRYLYDKPPYNNRKCGRLRFRPFCSYVIRMAHHTFGTILLLHSIRMCRILHGPYSSVTDLDWQLQTTLYLEIVAAVISPMVCMRARGKTPSAFPERSYLYYIYIYIMLHLSIDIYRQTIHGRGLQL